MPWLTDVVLLVLAYFIGAIPTGLLVGRAARGIDVRQHGSGNIGMTNVWRLLGWKLGLTTLLIDAGKAAAAVLLLAPLGAGAIPAIAVFLGLAVLLGNFFNIFLGGKGGKGVASSLGVFLALSPAAVLICFAVFVAVVYTTRYISAGSIVAAVLLPILTAMFQGITPVFWLVLVVAVLVIVKHRANIRRLLNGTESKFGRSSATAA
jgi:glycerol-3-phosphate acyltransferase PlsY